MQIPVNTDQFRFLVVDDPEPVLDFATKQQKLNKDGLAIFSINVLVKSDEHKGETITVKVPGNKPSVSEGQKVKISNLVAIPWENNGKSGVSFSAEKVEAIAASGKAAA